MRVRIAYGKTGLSINLPASAPVSVVQPRYVGGLPDAAGAIREALRNPIASPPLRELVRPSDTVGIVFNDITRPTPTSLILPVLREALPVRDAQIILFNATGAHRRNTDAELRAMLGEETVARYRIVQHDAADRDAHALIGVTSSGNSIWIEKAFLECDVKVLTGFIEPHFFAGFSGGGKAIMPGLASLETVQRNHCAANIDHPRARWGITRGNPLWEEISQAAKMAGPTFLLNVTLNRDKQITRVFAGDLTEAHARGCLFVRETAMVAVPSPFDIVIGTNSGYPLDLNLYQAVKGMSAAAQIVKPGGSIIIAAECSDGIPEHGEYGRLLSEAADPSSLLATLRSPGFSRRDGWQAHVQALISQRAEVYVYSRCLADAEITRALLKPCRSIETTVRRLRKRYGPDASICVLPEGPQTIPFLAEVGGAAGVPPG